MPFTNSSQYAKIYLGLNKDVLMHVITKKALDNFIKIHPDAKLALDTWYKVMNSRDFDNLIQLKKTFQSVDYIGGQKHIFNIKGNHYRLITSIQYTIHRVYVRAVLTHAEYDIHCKNNTLINL